MFIKKAILRFLVCFAAVFSASPFFLSRSVRADATGCLAADVSIYDADSGKRLDGGFYADLKAILYENGVRVKELSNMSGPQYRPRFLIGMDESSHFQAGHPLKLGNQYAFELIIPSGYTLDQIKLNKNYEGEPLPKAYKVSGNRITFIYDKEIQKQIQKPGVGGGFEVYYYLRKGSGSSSQGATKINLPKTEYKVTAGAKAFNLNAKVVNGSALTYHSSRPSVISVNKKGRITVKKPGQAVITVKSKASAKYTGKTVKVTITAAPRKTASVSAVSPRKKSLKITWKKVPSASGYTICYSDRKDMKNYQTATASGSRTVSLTVNNLAPGKYVYVRVRAYYMDGKTSISGKWSNAVRVKVR